MMIMTFIVLVGFLLWYDNVMRTIKSYLCSIVITNVTIYIVIMKCETKMVRVSVISSC
jgi:hypothetical protein